MNHKRQVAVVAVVVVSTAGASTATWLAFISTDAILLVFSDILGFNVSKVQVELNFWRGCSTETRHAVHHIG